jgi:hypothetical protein
VWTDCAAVGSEDGDERVQRVLVDLIRADVRWFTRSATDLQDRDAVSFVDVREAWTASQKEGSLRVVIDDEHWNPAKVAHLVINGYLAHDDADKQQKLNALGAVGSTLTRSVYIEYVTTSGAMAQRVARVIRTGLDDHKFR